MKTPLISAILGLGTGCIGGFLGRHEAQKSINLAAAGFIELPGQFEELGGTPAGKVVEVRFDFSDPLSRGDLEAGLVEIALQLAQCILTFVMIFGQMIGKGCKREVPKAEAVCGMGGSAEEGE